LAGQACAFVGPALLLCLLIGLLSFTPTAMLIGIALGVGGVVLMGSSKSSTEELELSLRQAEAARSAAIDALDLVEIHG
jgi:O-antigen ligase